jgi:histidinol dehydrogenase
MPKDVEVETMKGVHCYQKAKAIERIGIYIPGGTAPLFSTILMLAIPAQIAGVKEIVLCSPPTYHGGIHPTILATSKICGIDQVSQIGGAQAIAAMAVGTRSIPKVSKIFGPGNQYVTAAKENAQNYGVAIDMPAGPSEVLVYADETCVPAYVAADLLSQAEHGIDSQVVAVVSNQEIGDSINVAIIDQLDALPRKDIAIKALENSHIIIEPNVIKAFEYINAYGPEHFIIASDHAEELAELTVNAGSVFLGNLCPEAVGDYASGTNHTLPTYGWAKSYSGVNIDTFMRKITFQKLTTEGMASLGPIVVKMAEAEQLQGHANAVKIRLKDL